jgi:outer membrane protein TolC
VTQRRFDAGAATQVEINLALASTARTERRSETAHAVALEARSILAEVIGLDPAMPPDPAGQLDLPMGEPLPLDALVRGALDRRADLEAFRRSRETTEARLRLVEAGRIPDLSFGAFYKEEEGTDQILGAGITIGLPIFNMKRGEIEEAEASVRRAKAAAASKELAVRREVFALLAHYQAARRSVELLREQVVGNLESSLDLLGRSFTAGKIGLSDLLVSRRELIAARREFTEAVKTAWNARIALDLAVGELPAVAPSALFREDQAASFTSSPHVDHVQETLR